MPTSLPSTGETQVLSTEEHHGFVDNCIALIERLLDDGTIAAVIPHRVTPTAE